MRQKEDHIYRDILSNIRLGMITESDYKILKTRLIKFKGNGYDDKLEELCCHISNLASNAICLLRPRYLCQTLNEAMLKRINSDEIFLTAED